jgi:hypothetical protein
MRDTWWVMRDAWWPITRELMALAYVIYSLINIERMADSAIVVLLYIAVCRLKKIAEGRR